MKKSNIEPTGKLIICFEDNHLIAVNKRPGQPVQPEPGKPVSLEEEVKELIRIRDHKPGAVFLGVIHRLDMPVSGIVLFAKTSKALVRMNEQFKNRQVIKIYEAWVEHVPKSPEALITHWLRRDEKRRMTKAFPSPVTHAEEARLKYEITETNGSLACLRIQLLTGRKHQIRAQLSAIGSPICGDVKYGAASALPDQSIALRAVLLQFEHPVSKQQVTIQVNPE